MEINTFFDRVYVINLKSRVDRRVEMTEQLQRIGLNLESRNIALLEAVKPTDPAGFPSAGARGCFMSNLQLLREARESKCSSVLILEDDLNFCDDFLPRFNAVAAFLETVDWGMFYGTYQINPSLQNSGAPCVKVDPGLDVGTTAFIAFHGRHIDALVQYLEAILTRPAGDPHGGPMHVDGAYCWFRRSHPEVSTWLAVNQLGFQRSSRTDVNPLRWYDRASWSAGMVAGLRRVRNRIARQRGR